MHQEAQRFPYGAQFRLGRNVPFRYSETPENRGSAIRKLRSEQNRRSEHGRLRVTRQTLKVWDLQTGHLRRTLQGHSDWVLGVAITPDGKHAVSASWDQTLKVWDLGSGEIVSAFAADFPLQCCGVSTSGKTIVAGDQSGVVHLLRMENLHAY